MRVAGILAASAALSMLPGLAYAQQSPLPAKIEVQKKPDCTCPAAGRNFNLGEEACLRTPQGMRIATCIMVLNNTSWKFSDRACPES